MVQDTRRQFGIVDYEADKSLIAANMRGNHPAFAQHIDSGGKFVALVSDGLEFIWGDGFLHNFPPTPGGIANARCVVPVLPTVTILYARPLRYRSQPELVTMRLSDDEVRCLNEIVQVYSRQHIFFRSDRPKIIEHFARGEHLMFQYHKHDALEYLIDAAASFDPMCDVW